MDVTLWLNGLLRNIRCAVRTLRRTPAFSATVVLTLALGIGANSAVFSAIDTVLLQPLGFPHADRLMQLTQVQDQSSETSIAPTRLEDWNRMTAAFEAITGYYLEDVSETSGEFPERLRRAWVAPRFVETLGIAPQYGRTFTDAEHAQGGSPAVLISDSYWRRRLGADRGVLGKAVRVNGSLAPIVGVMPPDFSFPDRRVEMWFPTPMTTWLAPRRDVTWYKGIGRLKPDVTIDQARADLTAVQSLLANRYPETDRKITIGLVALKEATVGGVRASLWLLYGAVTILLLITCTNIAAMLLSRAAHRQQEMSVRLSLGASRATIAAQMLTETAVLAASGGALGLAMAATVSAAFRTAASDLPRVEEIAIDGRILLYTFVSTTAATLVCGILPALRAGRGRLAGAGAGARRTHVSGRNGVHWLLVGTQVSLSVSLLAGAALLARSFQALTQVNPGFDASQVLSFHVSGTWNETANYEALTRRIDGTLQELQRMPGVTTAATATFLPGVPAEFERELVLVEASTDAERRIVAEQRWVSPEYFRALQIPLMSGEPCRNSAVNEAREVMVNRVFVNRFLARWPSPIGLHLTVENSAIPPARIVGVVGDARERGLDRDPAPVTYSCFSAPGPTPYFLVRTKADPATFAPAVRLKMKQVEPTRAVYDLEPLRHRIGSAFIQNRLRTLLLAYFAATALLLACVGLYGTLSYTVTLRRREVGLRLALGAERADIIRHFVFQALRVVAVACACGLVLSLVFSQLLAGMLFGVSPSDPLVLTSVVVFVAVVATMAAFVPATRAAFVAPMHALREE